MQIVAFLDNQLKKIHYHFLQHHFFLSREKVLTDAPLGSSFPRVPNLLTVVKYLKNNTELFYKKDFLKILQNSQENTWSIPK